MKALTVYQPWASLISMGLKTVETRGWKTNYRGPLAIHAAKRLWPQAGVELLNNERVLEAWRHASGAEMQKAWHLWPHGAIVATCRLAYCREIPDWPALYVYDVRMKAEVRIEESLEGLLGDFTPGRFIWVLENIQPLIKPIPAMGRQGMWEWKNG